MKTALLLLAAEAAKPDKPFNWLGPIDWLDKHAGLNVLVTVVLAVITAKYVKLTSRYVTLTNKIVEAGERDRKERLWLQKAAQAGLVGGHVDWSQEQPDTLVLTVVNASPLPVRAVRGLARQVGGEGSFEFDNESVLKPGEWTFSKPVPEKLRGSQFVLLLRYHDDAGVAWEKYASNEEPLRLAR